MVLFIRIWSEHIFKFKFVKIRNTYICLIWKYYLKYQISNKIKKFENLLSIFINNNIFSKISKDINFLKNIIYHGSLFKNYYYSYKKKKLKPLRVPFLLVLFLLVPGSKFPSTLTKNGLLKACDDYILIIDVWPESVSECKGIEKLFVENFKSNFYLSLSGPKYPEYFGIKFSTGTSFPWTFEIEYGFIVHIFFFLV